MASEHENWLFCPCCGHRMSTVKVAIAAPPFLVELIGCEDCGVTTNELTAPPEPTDAARDRDGA